MGKDTLEYWKQRCLLAEKYIDESPCDPDIYDNQMKAYREWQDFKNDQTCNHIQNIKRERILKDT